MSVMSTIQGSLFWPVFRFQNGKQSQFSRTPISLPMGKNSASYHRLRKQIDSEVLQFPSVSQPTDARRSGNLCFSKKKPSDNECNCGHNKDFCCFTVREAVHDVEYWSAAWLRAESYWDEKMIDSSMVYYKMMYIEQQFNALKKRCSDQDAKKYTCIIAVKKEERNVKKNALKSIVGTLDISICKTTENRYGYVTNLCVAKSARRHGIASKMLQLAIEVTKSSGAENVFVHVHKDNTPALQLYEKIGFQMVETSTKNSSQHFLCIKTS